MLLTVSIFCKGAYSLPFHSLRLEYLNLIALYCILYAYRPRYKLGRDPSLVAERTGNQ